MLTDEEDNKLKAARALEVWLTKKTLGVSCRIVFGDETTVEFADDFVESLSLRGAEREITGWLISRGFKPVERWEYPEDADEAVRKFRQAKEGKAAA